VSRLHRNHPGSHSSKSSTSREAKFLKIVMSSSSAEKIKLKSLYSPNKGSLKDIKVHEGSESSKVNHNLKCPFGVHQTYTQESKRDLMQLYYNSKSLF
jgi:hypothetical protein